MYNSLYTHDKFTSDFLLGIEQRFNYLEQEIKSLKAELAEFVPSRSYLGNNVELYGKVNKNRPK